MSIGIAIAVPDGIALAADTQTTWSRTISKAKTKAGVEAELADPILLPIGWSQEARKLFSVSLAGRTFGIVSAGEALLNSRSMFATFRSAATKYDGPAPTCVQAVEHFRNHLRCELSLQLGCSPGGLANQAVKVCEFILAGYDDDDVAKPFIQSHLVWSGTLTIDGTPDASGARVRWANESQPGRYGGCWIGQVPFISHLVNHKNPELPPLSGQYGMMTLADAVAYTKFLVAFVCDFQRFAVMVPNCGRPLSSATLTPESYAQELVP